MRETINAVIIRNKKILLVKKEKSWLLPEGKPNPDESDIECLCREVDEELSGTLLKDIEFYGKFIGKIPKKDLKQRFILQILGGSSDLLLQKYLNLSGFKIQISIIFLI
jgi:ADP-ribose pyrophosphatase YjhB (NUDIX family)